jgi:hypothetical protein
MSSQTMPSQRTVPSSTCRRSRLPCIGMMGGDRDGEHTEEARDGEVRSASGTVAHADDGDGGPAYGRTTERLEAQRRVRVVAVHDAEGGRLKVDAIEGDAQRDDEGGLSLTTTATRLQRTQRGAAARRAVATCGGGERGVGCFGTVTTRERAVETEAAVEGAVQGGRRHHRRRRQRLRSQQTERRTNTEREQSRVCGDCGAAFDQALANRRDERAQVLGMWRHLDDGMPRRELDDSSLRLTEAGKRIVRVRVEAVEAATDDGDCQTRKVGTEDRARSVSRAEQRRGDCGLRSIASVACRWCRRQ